WVPAGAPGGRPVVGVLRQRHEADQRVVGGTAAEDAGPRVEDGRVAARLFDRGGRAVVLGAQQVDPVAEAQDALVPYVAGTALDHADTAVGVLAQSGGEHTAGGAAADDDVVVGGLGAVRGGGGGHGVPFVRALRVLWSAEVPRYRGTGVPGCWNAGVLECLRWVPGAAGSALEPAGRPRGEVLVDVLGLLVLAQARRPELAPDAGAAEAAPLGLRYVRVEVVDPHGAVPQPLGDALGAARVGRPDAAGQAVAGVVGQFHRLVLGAEPLHGDDRAEDLVLHDAH